MTDATAGVTSPLVWRRWLGSELIRLRTEAELTQRDVANELQCSVAKISYLESGDRPVSVRELQDVLLDLFEVPPESWRRYIDAAELANRAGWWDRYSDQDLERAERRYVGLEDGAHRLRAYQPSIFHGLLQTPDYSRANLQIFKTFSGERIARLTELRTERQAALRRQPSPLHAHLVLDEAAVRREIGGPQVLRAQLLHAADVVEQTSNLTLQILPFTTGAHGANFGPFSILDFPWAGDLGLVYIEGLVKATYLESPKEIYPHSIAFDRLAQLALESEESVAMLRSIARTVDS